MLFTCTRRYVTFEAAAIIGKGCFSRLVLYTASYFFVRLFVSRYNVIQRKLPLLAFLCEISLEDSMGSELRSLFLIRPFFCALSVFQ